jgi:hypothetical protein
MAVVSVEGGQLSKEQVQGQLERLFPGKWAWELKNHDENSFLTTFPSKVELQRAIAFGGAMVRGVDVPVGARIIFDEWHEKETGFLLPKVWVKVFGIRKELREFLILWAVGSLIGSPQVVDMETTRKSDFGRISVTVLNPSLIPANLDVVVGDHYFELEFEVEKLGTDENGDEVEIEWTGGGNEKAVIGMEEEGGLGDGDDGDDDLRVSKRPKKSPGLGADGKIGGDSGVVKNIGKADEGVTMFEQVQNMTKSEFEEFLRNKAEEILGVAADRVMDEIVDKVMEGKEGEEKQGEPTEGKLGKKGKLMEMAAIPEASKGQVRSSPRLQRSKDENALAKAEERAA